MMLCDRHVIRRAACRRKPRAHGRRAFADAASTGLPAGVANASAVAGRLISPRYCYLMLCQRRSQINMVRHK